MNRLKLMMYEYVFNKEAELDNKLKVAQARIRCSSVFEDDVMKYYLALHDVLSFMALETEILKLLDMY